MKKQLFVALAILFLSGTTRAQETPEKKDSKFEFVVNGKLGFARLKQSGNIPLNGNLTGSDILVSYQISPKWDIASGVGIYEFNANATSFGNSYSLKNSYLRIPVQFNGDFSVFKNEKNGNEKIFFTVGLGLYANTLLKQEIEAINGSIEEKNLGWNFGFSSQVGAKFLLSDALNIGIGLESQSDFTKMEKNGNKQRIEQFNGMYFKLGFTF
jgi:hypothetical protein